MRYLKITGNLVFAQEALAKEDLVRLSHGGYDIIIDMEELKTFDVDTNSWQPIQELKS